MDKEKIRLKLEIIKIRIDYYHKISLLVIAIIGGLWVWGFSNQGILADISLAICYFLLILIPIFMLKLYSLNENLKRIENEL